MKDELQAELKHRYTKLMRAPGLRYFVADDTAPEAAELVSNFGPIDERGIECGEGWFELVNRLSAACEKEIDAMAAAGVAMEYCFGAVQNQGKVWHAALSRARKAVRGPQGRNTKSRGSR
ncbi:MAG: hypothetical protein IPJ48_17320 [Propionivibrio sp.]|uniref:Uncharacterized protein n=1 Tax=Candidatus Propionivibrio dominans TaxID=2954373 RepID=A0A9D7IA08_9RHOO|nr:hypothetical protein [Candidatus Propionivibrio dominans]